MGLVDYSDSDSASDSAPEPSPKRRKSSSGAAALTATANRLTDLPPLPDSFYDHYASTVRTSVVDDPSLHGGRKRSTPHIVGHWPSHVYIEWHPSAKEHDVLLSLVRHAQENVPRAKLTSFLTSDLGAPLPLHISLSRPLSLTTAQKDDFLEDLTKSIRASAVPPFHAKPQALSFYKSPDSDRTFLIVRVQPAPPPSSQSAGSSHPATHSKPPRNHLSTLLRRCNAIAEKFDQPLLYRRNGDIDESAFHISLAWTLDDVTSSPSPSSPPSGGEDQGRASEEGPGGIEIPLSGPGRTEFDEVRGWNVRVAGVKVKIGNVVTHLGLEKGPESGSKELFGY